MPKIRNVSGVDRYTRDRLVVAKSAIDVPAEEVWGYTQQEANWAPFDDEAQEIHDFHLEVIAYLAAVEAERVAALNAPAATSDPGEQPGGNASRDEWAAYVIDAELATEDDLAGKGRDEIRDTYKLED